MTHEFYSLKVRQAIQYVRNAESALERLLVCIQGKDDQTAPQPKKELSPSRDIAAEILEMRNRITRLEKHGFARRNNEHGQKSQSHHA